MNLNELADSVAEQMDEIREAILSEAARRVIAACGCQTEGGCEDERGGESAAMPYVKHRGCARFVRAVRGEAP